MVKDNGFKWQRMPSVAEKIQLLTALLKWGSLPNLRIIGCVEGSHQNKKKNSSAKQKGIFFPDMCDKKGERWHHLSIRLRHFSI